MHAFWLVLTYDLLEDTYDDVIIKFFFNSLLYKTNRFQVAVFLFSDRSRRTSKCSKTTFGLNVLEKKEIEKQLVFSIFTVTTVVLDWFVSDWFYLDSFLQWISWFERATMGICNFFFFWPFNFEECLASNSPNSITHKSNVEVMRVKEMITYLRISWLSNKFFLLVP